MKHLRIPLLLVCAVTMMIASWYLLYFVGLNAFDVMEEAGSVDLDLALRHGTEASPNFATSFVITLLTSLIFALVGALLTRKKA